MGRLLWPGAYQIKDGSILNQSRFDGVCSIVFCLALPQVLEMLFLFFLEVRIFSCSVMLGGLKQQPGLDVFFGLRILWVFWE